ncbi:MAG: mechanosensitive ion channel, partial [Lentisphaeria bacterium]|nr:mechanosensitive ion channel [Lentisphaeria bacterium]
MMNFFLATTGKTAAAAVDSAESGLHVVPVEEVIPEVTRYVGTFSEQASGWFSANQSALLYFAIGVAVTVAVAFLFDRGLLRLISKLVLRTKTELDDKLFASVASPLRWFILETGFILSLRTSIFGPEITAYIVRGYCAAATLTVVWGLMRAIDVLNVYFLKLAEKTQGNLDNLLIDLLRRVIKSVIWSIALLFIAQNIFGWNVSALLAGAGVIGLAIAFAAQNTIANVFGALMLIA